MRKFFIYMLVALLAFPLTGCESMFDRETPPNKLSGENAIVDQPSAENALNGIYGYLHGFGDLSANYIADNEFRSGMLTGRFRGSFDDTENAQFKVPYESTYISSPWDRVYEMINASNNFLFYIDKVAESSFSGKRKTEMIAEARFMRAFGHLFLLRRYGYFWDIESQYGPIIRMEKSSLSNNAKGRSTVAESYQKIFEDFDFAIKNGPAYYSKFRSSATLAKAFMADALMNRGAEGDYALAADLALQVINSSEYGMENTFADVYANGYKSKELMFTRFIKTPPENIDYNTSTILKMFCGNGTYKPTTAYLEILTPDDKRYNVTFMDWEFTSGSNKFTEIIWKKHYVSNGDCPMYYMRVAQMYLIRAEALLRTGATKKSVLDELNVLRNRSGNTLFNESDYATTQEIMDEIFNENVREIGMENGGLFYLTVRMKNNNGDRKIKSYNSFFTDDNQLCYPIPKSEMDYNPVIAEQQKPL